MAQWEGAEGGGDGCCAAEKRRANQEWREPEEWELEMATWPNFMAREAEAFSVGDG